MRLRKQRIAPMAKISMSVFRTCASVEKREKSTFKWQAKTPLYFFLEHDAPVDGCHRSHIVDFKIVGFGDTKVEAAVDSVYFACEQGHEIVNLINNAALTAEEIELVFKIGDFQGPSAIKANLACYQKSLLKEAKNA